MGDTAGLVWFNMIFKVVAIAFLLIILGRTFADPFIKEKKSPPEEHHLGFSSEKSASVKEIQRILKDEGSYAGQADGFLGEETRRAVKAFQKKNRLEATGKIDLLTLESLRKWKESQVPLLNNVAMRTDVPQDQPSTQSAGFVWDENDFNRVKQVQTALKKAGYYKGKIDGQNGRKTRRALRAFQVSNGLVNDGVAGQKTLDRLKALMAK